MKWFKHDSDASSDAKIKKLLIRYGAVGYAVYFHCLELIAGNVSNDNITFELEHDSEIIADNLRIRGTSDKSGVQVVEEIMRYLIDLNLFENHDGRITCFKMIKRLDSSMTSNSRFRKLILEAKSHHVLLPNNHDSNAKSHDPVMMDHDSVMQEENRIEENRIEENRIEEKRREECPELSHEISGTPFIDLPKIGSVSQPDKVHTVTEEDIAQYQEVYPNVDVKAELKKMKLWLDANPSKRKKNVKSFIARWLAKEQDKPQPKKKKTFEEIKAEMIERYGDI
jgi:hypothetical protein